MTSIMPPSVISSQFDPRYYQLLVQLALLVWGSLVAGFTVSLGACAWVLGAALGCQYGLSQYYRLRFQPLSSLNTALSVLLLLQASEVVWLLLATMLAISSKFWLRWQQRHVFNPSNIGIVLVLLLSDAIWVAHGKWGQAIWLGLLLAGMGLVFVLGWRQMLTSLSFLLVYTLLVCGRAGWLGDPLAIPLHQLQNGALLIFAFFMLSDPLTTPAASLGRLLFGGWVALLAVYLQWFWYVPNAFLYALACSSPLVIVMNHQFGGAHFRWGTRRML